MVWSTTIGSVIGPNLAEPGAAVASALHLPALTGAFLLSSISMTVAAFLLWVWLRPDPLLLSREHLATGDTAANPRESLSSTLKSVRRHLRRSPRAALAFATIVMANTVMGAVMTMTPVSMTRDGAALTIVGITISGHLLGMYAFAPIVGWLSDRFGTLPVAVTGQIVFLLSALASILGRGSIAWTMTGLFLLGLGWSFGLVAGSAMLNETTPAALRPGAQGTADTAMNVVAAVAAGMAGPLMSVLGFAGLNIFAAVLVVPVLIFSVVVARIPQHTKTQGASEQD